MLSKISNYFRKRREARLERQRKLLEAQRQEYLQLHYQCNRNLLYLRSQLPTLNMRKSHAKGETSGETRKIRERIKSRIDWITSKIAEEEFYSNYYLKLSKA